MTLIWCVDRPSEVTRKMNWASCCDTLSIQSPKRSTTSTATWNSSHGRHTWRTATTHQFGESASCDGCPCTLMRTTSSAARSEEHTSELQSLMRISYAVFCLKTKTNQNTTTLSSSPYTIT